MCVYSVRKAFLGVSELKKKKKEIVIEDIWRDEDSFIFSNFQSGDLYFKKSKRSRGKKKRNFDLLETFCRKD